MNQVASIQTLSKRHKPNADILIIDETHLACSKSFLDLIAQYPKAVVIGLTATPIRLDGRGLGEIYEDMVQVVPMSRLIADGNLVRPRVFAPYIPDTSGVSTSKGDYDSAQIADLMDKSAITGDIVKHWMASAKGRKTIAFAASVAHSEHIRDAFRESGVHAEHLDGSTPKPKREATLMRWRRGDFEVLTNCGLFIEGLDVPDVSCCILARPTQSLTIYLQAVGRAMRPAPGKNDCIVLDHAGLTYKHGLIDEDREWTLEGRKKKGKKASEDEALNVTICDGCFAAYNRQEYDSCPQCGKAAPKRAQKAADVSAEGELKELTKADMDRLKQQKKDELKAARTKDDLIELGKRRGYRYPAQWADHILEGRKQFAAARYQGASSHV